MLAIKLQRIGKKGQASFRIVVQEKRSKLNGRSVEDLGWFNPHTDQFNLKAENAKSWLSKGAQPTDSAFNLMVKAGIIPGPKRAVHGKGKKIESKEAATVADKKEEKPQENAETPSS